MRTPQAYPGRWSRDRRWRVALAFLAALALWNVPPSPGPNDATAFAAGRAPDGGEAVEPLAASCAASSDDDDSLAGGAGVALVCGLEIEPPRAGRAAQADELAVPPDRRTVRRGGRSPPSLARS